MSRNDFGKRITRLMSNFDKYKDNIFKIMTDLICKLVTNSEIVL